MGKTEPSVSGEAAAVLLCEGCWGFRAEVLGSLRQAQAATLVLPGWMAFHSPFTPWRQATALRTTSYRSKVNGHKKKSHRRSNKMSQIILTWKAKSDLEKVQTPLSAKENFLWCWSNVNVCQRQFNFRLAADVCIYLRSENSGFSEII